MKFTSSIIILSYSIFATTVHATVATPPASATIKTVKTINLNSASLNELSHAIKGIGKKRAQAILQYREKHGHFKSLTDLAAVHGLGHRFVQKHWTELQAVFVF